MLLLCFTTSYVGAGQSIHVETFQGKDIAVHSQEIVNLCNQIYREYPYFYNGDDAEYTAYLKTYSQSENAVITLAFDGDIVVGLAAGIPMTDTREFYQQTLKDHRFDLLSIFYLGEFGLHPAYKDQGIEEAMYQTIEDFARHDGRFKAVYVWELDKPADSELKPAGFLPRDDFWENLGFKKHPRLEFEILWTNIGDDVESSHRAVYSIKNL